MRSPQGGALALTRTGAVGRPGQPVAGRRRVGRIAGIAITAIVASLMVPAAPAFAATPPVFPENIIIFPNRDFVVLDGYAANAAATITVMRGLVVTGMAQGTTDATGFLEVNHPGGVAWGTGPGAPQVTPNIKAGDVVTVAIGAGSDSATTQSPTVTGFTQPIANPNQVVVTGTLGAPGGPPPNRANFEQRIVVAGDALVLSDVGRRDVRAGGNLPGVFTSTIAFTATTFTATYNFTRVSTADIVAGGQARALTWMVTDAAAERQGMTIAEFGEIGGPGIPGGPAGPENTAPNAPANVRGIRGNFSLTASWDRATTIPDGSAVTGYVLEVQPVGGGLIAREVIVGANVLTFAVGGLTNEIPYNISVRASSAVGTGPEGTAGPVTPSASVATVAGPPTAVGATAGNASAVVRWTPPVDNGGSTITTYSVRVLNAAGAPLSILRTAPGSARSLLVTGLTNGTAYRFRVGATNLTGNGTASANSAAVTPSTVASAPGIGTATAGNASALVRWTTPATNGGSLITGYSVRVLNAATGAAIGSLRPASASARSLTVTGLVNGTAVRFRVGANNARGLGAGSALSNAVTPATVPSAPRIGTATAGNASALVRWTAPVTNGGSLITGYSVRVLNASTGAAIGGLRPASASARSLTVTGLANGTAVRFRVGARNALGLGAGSALSNPVTPR